jgi:hypothetical protein
MKLIKSFSKTLYSEVIIPTSSSISDKEREDGSLIKEEGEHADSISSHDYLGGLGLKFKFPGDAKK